MMADRVHDRKRPIVTTAREFQVYATPGAVSDLLDGKLSSLTRGDSRGRA